MKRKQHLQYLESWTQHLQFGLKGGRPYSQNSIDCYTIYVKSFLKEHQELSVNNLKSALMSIPVIQFAKREKIFVALNCFAKYLITENQLTTDYLTAVKQFKPKRHLPPKKVTVGQDAIGKLLSVSQDMLDRLIITLISQTGLRASEACALRISDIDLENQFLTVRYAKWGKSRRVGLPIHVVEAISSYKKVRPQADHDFLLSNRKGGQMDRHGIQQRVQRLGIMAKVPANPHALRRAFVTINANSGKPLVMLQIACGHNDIATTRSYCMTTEDEVVSAMAGWHWT